MLTDFSVLAVIIVAVFVLQPLLVYLKDSQGLRKFPTPSFAGISSLWRVIQNLRYRHYLSIHEAHKTLGTHVRIAPKHISISDPRALNEIYGHGANMLKDPWYDGGAGEFRHMADARVKSEHQNKRRMLAHVFAQKTIADLEPVISDVIGVMVAQLNKKVDKAETVNMRRYLNFFTIDVFSRLLFNESLGCLERGNDMVQAAGPDGKVTEVPFVKTLNDATHINTFLGFEAGLLPITRKLFANHPYKKAGANWDKIIYHNTSKRLRDTTIDTDEDIFGKLLINSKGEPTGLVLGEILAEANVMMNAGTDTTTAALTGTIYLLHKHPEVLAKVRAEIDELCGSSCTLPSYESLARLPYLRACIEEALRVRPASTMGLPRVVPDGGRVIAGQFVAGGVTVSVPTYTLLRDAVAFSPDPEAYRPDRWLTEDKTEKERMAKAHFPFSTGPRACIGRNIAYYEQILLIATLVRQFEFEFVEGPGFELQVLERFNANPGEMDMRLRRRVIV